MSSCTRVNNFINSLNLQAERLCEKVGLPKNTAKCMVISLAVSASFTALAGLLFVGMISPWAVLAAGSVAAVASLIRGIAGAIMRKNGMEEIPWWGNLLLSSAIILVSGLFISAFLPYQVSIAGALFGACFAIALAYFREGRKPTMPTFRSQVFLL